MNRTRRKRLSYEHCARSPVIRGVRFFSYGGTMSKVRVYHLAKELKIASQKILDELHRLGVNIKVPSNCVSEKTANIIRAKFQHNDPPQKQATSGKIIRLSNAKKAQGEKQADKVSPRKAQTNQSSNSNYKPWRENRMTEIILKSKKARKIYENLTCSRCGSWIKPFWRYSRSNFGVVHLCSSCQPLVYRNSFGSVDALDMAHQGGLFERNRRKH
jgi:Translation initiation factor IF-2, N-terminal region